MHDLIVLPDSAAGTLTTADALTQLEAEAVLEFAQAAKSRASLRAYASDWQDFRAWCAARGATALPATPAMVCGYISTLASGRRCRRWPLIGPAERIFLAAIGAVALILIMTA